MKRNQKKPIEILILRQLVSYASALQFNAAVLFLMEINILPVVSTVRVPPQNMIIIGGGPSGLMTTIHCTENVLLSGGTIRLLEARDSFVKGGSSFERAQIVRLDARWIATLRYHLGTGFEDVFIPASGETDPQLSNSL